MSSKGVPPIPPRPSRSPRTATESPPNAKIPKIPPRPANRVSERNGSPKQDNYAPSPLNEPPSSLMTPRESSSIESSRPSSSVVPSSEQEGIKYEKMDSQGVVAANDKRDHVETPAETRNVHQDLQLHAPKPSLPTSSAEAKVQVVTRTDSKQATALGLDSLESSDQPVHSREITRRDSSNVSPDRRKSPQRGEEQGIPEIGQRVPMYPDAGDVQAPSPSPEPTSVHNNDQMRSGHQNRAHSAQKASIPPGHGAPSNDPLEKDWYDKHPDELAREKQGHHGPGVDSPPAEMAMSSDDLNQTVKMSANKGTGLGTSAELMATPEEEIGNIATEELASRLTSSPKVSRLQGEEAHTSQPANKSPFPNEHAPKGSNEVPIAEPTEPIRENEDNEVEIHVDDPLHHQHHPDGFAPAPETGKSHEGEVTEQMKDVPIIPSDEIGPDAARLHPAVSPTLDQEKESGYFGHQNESPEHKRHSSSASTADKRIPSPSVSMPNARLEENETKHVSHEDAEQRGSSVSSGKAQQGVSVEQGPTQTADVHQQQFLSKDIPEDPSSSSQLQTAVTPPDVPKRPTGAESGRLFETPEQESERTELANKSAPDSGLDESQTSLEDHKPQEHDAKQRFPSNDIWEEAPESQKLITTVQQPEKPEKLEKPEKPTSPEVPSKPSFPLVPSRPARRMQQAPSEDQRSPVSATEKSESPTAEMKKPPPITARPKPSIPSRPARNVNRSPEKGLTKTVSGSSNETITPPVVKPKPAVPSRPAGSKIAALKAGLLSDLGDRLVLGPQAPKPKEPEPEPPVKKGPLTDARKGRARGPPRRKPAAPTAPEQLVKKDETPRMAKVTVVDPWSVWTVGNDGHLSVSGEKRIEKEPEIKASPTEPSPILPTTTESSSASELDDQKTSPPPDTDKATEPKPKDIDNDMQHDLTGDVEPCTSPTPPAVESAEVIKDEPVTEPTDEHTSETPTKPESPEDIEPSVTLSQTISAGAEESSKTEPEQQPSDSPVERKSLDLSKEPES